MWEFQVKVCSETTLRDEQRLCHVKKVHRLAILIRHCCGIPQSLQKSTTVVCPVRPWLLPSTAFPIHCSLVILSVIDIRSHTHTFL